MYEPRGEFPVSAPGLFRPDACQWADMSQAAIASAAMITMNRSVRPLLSIAALTVSHIPPSPTVLGLLSGALPSPVAGTSGSAGRLASAWPRALSPCQSQNVLFILEEVRLTNWRAEVEAYEGGEVDDFVWETLDSYGDVESLQLGLMTMAQLAAKARRLAAVLSGWRRLSRA